MQLLQLLPRRPGLGLVHARRGGALEVQPAAVLTIMMTTMMMPHLHRLRPQVLTRLRRLRLRHSREGRQAVPPLDMLLHLPWMQYLQCPRLPHGGPQMAAARLLQLLKAPQAMLLSLDPFQLLHQVMEEHPQPLLCPPLPMVMPPRKSMRRALQPASPVRSLARTRMSPWNFPQCQAPFSLPTRTSATGTSSSSSHSHSSRK